MQEATNPPPPAPLATDPLPASSAVMNPLPATPLLTAVFSLFVCIKPRTNPTLNQTILSLCDLLYNQPLVFPYHTTPPAVHSPHLRHLLPRPTCGTLRTLSTFQSAAPTTLRHSPNPQHPRHLAGLPIPGTSVSQKMAPQSFPDSLRAPRSTIAKIRFSSHNARTGEQPVIS